MSDIRRFTEQDYSTLVEWWTARKFPVIPLAFLPATGLVAEGYAMGFIYRTDTPLGWLEWLTTNPESDKIHRSNALDLLISHCIKEASLMGLKALFSSVTHPTLIERYKAQGFTVSDQGMTNLIRAL